MIKDNNGFCHCEVCGASGNWDKFISAGLCHVDRKEMTRPEIVKGLQSEVSKDTLDRILCWSTEDLLKLLKYYQDEKKS